MNKALIKLINDNPDLPIFAWVDGEICADSCGYWLGKFGNASIREYAKVEPYDWFDRDFIFKDEPEDYIEYLLNKDESITLEDAEAIIKRLDYKKAIFIYVHTPDNF